MLEICNTYRNQRAKVVPDACFLDELRVHDVLHRLWVDSDNKLKQTVGLDSAGVFACHYIKQLKLVVHACSQQICLDLVDAVDVLTLG